MTKEPAVIVGTITALAAAIITLIVAFYPDALTEDQKTALLGVVAVAAPVIAGLITRSFVSPSFEDDNYADAEPVEPRRAAIDDGFGV